MVKYDCTVRNAANDVIQFVYGDSGIDSARQFEHSLKLLIMSDADIIKKYKFTTDELKQYNISQKENDNYINDMLSMRDQLRTSQRKVLLDYKTLSGNYMLPVNFNRIIDNTRAIKMESKEKLDAKYIIDKLNDVLDYKNTMLFALGKDEMNNKNSIRYKDEMVSKTIFKFAMIEYLAPKRCLAEYNLSKAQFEEIIEQIIKSYNKAVIEPGEMVGVIAAQSTGEPVTRWVIKSIC